MAAIVAYANGFGKSDVSAVFQTLSDKTTQTSEVRRLVSTLTGSCIRGIVAAPQEKCERLL
jgi:hypothetical protein